MSDSDEKLIRIRDDLRKQHDAMEEERDALISERKKMEERITALNKKTNQLKHAIQSLEVAINGGKKPATELPPRSQVASVSPRRLRIIEVLERRGDWTAPGDIAKEMDDDSSIIGGYLFRMFKAGKVQRKQLSARRFLYRVGAKSKPAPAKPKPKPAPKRKAKLPPRKKAKPKPKKKPVKERLDKGTVKQLVEMAIEAMEEEVWYTAQGILEAAARKRIISRNVSYERAPDLEAALISSQRFYQRDEDGRTEFKKL